MPATRLVIPLLAALIGAGCSGSNPKQLLETAAFEEKQNNREHALKLYQEIVDRHGTSPEAAVARERLKELRK